MQLKEEMVDSIIKEIEIRSNHLVEGDDISIIYKHEKIETIYFGGGTPSLLSKKELQRIMMAVYKNYSVVELPEITFEANPDDIYLEKLLEWKNCGINRLSIGIQSFREEDLLWMNRAHNATQAANCIALARDAGFTNFSIDLIFGTPGLSNENWIENVDKAIDLQVPHIACYALTVEPKTALHKMIVLKKKEDVDNELQAQQYAILMHKMREAGYEHYEISNFAKYGYRSRHNSSYWHGKSYIGIGPSAHSFNGKERIWNKANNPIYIQSLKKSIIPFEKEILTQNQQLEEYIMTSLRISEGMNLKLVENIFSKEARKRIEHILMTEIESDQFLLENDTIILTDKGKLFADAISVKLFL